MAVLTRPAVFVRSGAGAVLALALCVAPLLTGLHAGDASRSTRVQPVAAHATSFTPHTGATFNKPYGTRAQQRRIFVLVNRTIDAVPRGGTIKIAVFSFTEKATADALLRARARGVRVRIIFDDHKIYKQEARLRRDIGKNPNARSFVLDRHHACRGTEGDMHDKIFLFSQAGGARDISMVGSNNMTHFNATSEWSDVYTMANRPAMYLSYSHLFATLKAGQAHPKAATRSSFYRVLHGRYKAWFFPDPGVSRALDPVLTILSQVSCSGAAPGTGVSGHTLVRISMHAWYGARGYAIAQKVAGLRQSGCNVQVIPGATMGSTIRSTLRNAKVALATIRHPSKRTHQKVLQVSGHFGHDTSARLIFAGSHNWSNRGLQCDDNILRIDDPAAYRQYASNFRLIWHHG